ncbi:hypothetical protein MIDIC_310010 [Alphaproteobacteria bacterium]
MEYGKWATVHKRFMRWAKAGIWQMVFNTLAVDEDKWIMIDLTMIRARQHAAGARTRVRKVERGLYNKTSCSMVFDYCWSKVRLYKGSGSYRRQDKGSVDS